MSSVAQRQQAEPSAERVELIRLVQSIGKEAQIDVHQNGNGFVVVATIERDNGKRIRAYAEGASTLLAAERACLAAVRSMLGGAP